MGWCLQADDGLERRESAWLVCVCDCVVQIRGSFVAVSRGIWEGEEIGYSRKAEDWGCRQRFCGKALAFEKQKRGDWNSQLAKWNGMRLEGMEHTSRFTISPRCEFSPFVVVMNMYFLTGGKQSKMKFRVLESTGLDWIGLDWIVMVKWEIVVLMLFREVRLHDLTRTGF